MADVIADNTWIDGRWFVAKGTRREDVQADLVGRVGSHLWAEEGEQANFSADGEALTGLRETVWIDGKSYGKGTVPPADVIPKVGSHMWVPGFTPPQPAGPAVPAEPSAGAGDDEVEGAPVAEPSGTPSPPPQGGPKGSAKAWHEYAAAVGVEVDADAKRDDVIDAVKAAGKPVE